MSTLLSKIESAVISIQGKTKIPAFREGDVLDVDSEITILKRSFATSQTIYPFIYAQQNYNSKELLPNRFQTDIILFIVDKANADYTAKQRRLNEWTNLTDLKDKIKRALELESISFLEPEHKIENYKAEENKFSVPINIMTLKLNELQYCLI